MQSPDVSPSVIKVISMPVSFSPFNLYHMLSIFCTPIQIGSKFLFNPYNLNIVNFYDEMYLYILWSTKVKNTYPIT